MANVQDFWGSPVEFSESRFCRLKYVGGQKELIVELRTGDNVRNCWFSVFRFTGTESPNCLMSVKCEFWLWLPHLSFGYLISRASTETRLAYDKHSPIIVFRTWS